MSGGRSGRSTTSSGDHGPLPLPPFPGFHADIAVFSRYLLTARPDEILHDTRCDLAILGGKLVYDRAGDTAEARRRDDAEAQ
jgi:hypothetical protein